MVHKSSEATQRFLSDSRLVNENVNKQTETAQASDSDLHLNISGASAQCENWLKEESNERRQHGHLIVQQDQLTMAFIVAELTMS